MVNRNKKLIFVSEIYITYGTKEYTRKIAEWNSDNVDRYENQPPILW